MPAAQLLTAVVEAAINKLLAMDEQSANRLTQLAGKQLRVELQESPWPLTFSFSDKVDVMANSSEEVDCTLRLSVKTLAKLQDNSQLTQLIQNRELELIGDIHVAQSFSLVIKELDIDWEEQLSLYTGDIFAHQAMRNAKQAGQSIKTAAARLESLLRDAAIEEKAIVPHPLAVTHFNQQVDQLRADVGRFEARLNQLTKKSQT